MIYLGGVPLGEFIAQAVQSGSTTQVVIRGGSIYSSSNMQAMHQEVPTKTFGQEEIPNISVSLENLVFEGTTVGRAQTQGSIEMTQAKVQNAYAQGQITATDSALGTVKSDSGVNLTNCTFSQVKANGTTIAVECDTDGFLQANGSMDITNCSKLSGKANGSLTISGCKELGNLKANGSAHVTASTVDSVKANDSVNISNSKINTLEFSGSMTINGSEVGTLIVNPPGGCGMVIINGIQMQHSSSGQVSTIYLTNTNIKNIEFVGHQGKVVLRGSSTVTGTITNGIIIPSKV